jgi:hypothetical protein
VAAEHNSWINVVTLVGTEAIYQLVLDDAEGMRVATDRLVDASHNPEIPDAERENLVRNLLYAKGLASVRLGDIEAGEKTLERLRKLDRVWAVYLEYLEREIAVANGDVDRVGELFETLPDSCLGDLERGHYLWLAGGIERAAPYFLERFADPSGCAAVGETRLRFADGHVILAELALKNGDLEGAAKHLDAYDALWPAADPEIRICVRAADLRGRPGDPR